MSTAFDQHSDGTAPFNETEAFHANAQGDDGEATDPEGARRRAEIASQLPDGFFMGSTADGKPMPKPTLAYTREMLEEVRDVFDNRELREAEFDFSDISGALERTYAQLAEVNEFAANGFLYSMERAHAQSMASAVRWLVIHATNLQRHQDNGNENAAENSLLQFEASKKQAFLEAALLDFCQDNGIDVNLQRGTQGALNLAGWQLMNQHKTSDRKVAQQTTRSLLWNGRQEEQAADPADTVEEDDE